MAPPIDSAAQDVARLKRVLSTIRTARIKATEPRAHLRAVASAWFQSYRPAIQLPDEQLADADASFRALLEAAGRESATDKTKKTVSALGRQLRDLQTLVVVTAGQSGPVADRPPSFASVSDPLMRQVLHRRWEECLKCIAADAPLAAAVMIGGLLESLFLARINREPNLKAVFTAASSPKDSKTGNPLQLKDWTLRDYIAVAHELGWVSQSLRDVSQVLRDYRNYIHPQKELSNQLALTLGDATMFWSVFKAIALQLL